MLSIYAISTKSFKDSLLHTILKETTKMKPQIKILSISSKYSQMTLAMIGTFNYPWIYGLIT